MSVRPPEIVYGVFKGMGDLLWAVPVIRSELAQGQAVHLVLFPSKPLIEFCSLIDFGPDASRLSLHALPKGALEGWRFIRQLSRLSPNIVWISPHAPHADSSWKIPFALWTFKKFFCPDARMVGASTEKLAWIFDASIPIDRKLALRMREWTMYRMFRNGLVPLEAPQPRFDDEIMAASRQPPRFDLVIHPGATAKNRFWPLSKYPELIARLPRNWKIAVLGLAEDVLPLKQMIPQERSIDFITGSLRLSLMTLASARLLLVMDSGNVHFAEVLGRPAVALFGKEDPATIVAPGIVDPVYERSVECQPCGRALCTRSEVFCLTNLSP
jgi:heptosyltransferase-2